MPPIDPSIILGLKQAPIQQRDPLEQYGKSLALQNLMRQGDAADRSEKRSASLQALLATNPDEQALRRGGFLEESLKVGKAGQERAHMDAQTGELKAKTAKSEQDVQIGKIQHTSSIMSTAKDQPTWDMARRVLSVTFPGIEKNLPEQFDPQFVSAKIAEGQTIAQKLAAEATQRQQAETGRHNLAGEANAARTLAETGRHNLAGEATATGNLANARDRLALDQSMPKGVLDAERGLIIDPRTGEARPVTLGGSPVGAKEKPLTEAQGRGQMFGTRAAEADKILQGIEEKISTTGLAIKERAANMPVAGGVLGAVGNVLLSKDQQRVEQAQRNFVNAVLRQESGAVISPSEFENAKKQYFPQPGDSKEVLAQKRANRQTAIEGFRVMAGSAGPRIEEARSQPSTQTVAKPKIGERRDGYLFKGGDPASQSSWEKV